MNFIKNNKNNNCEMRIEHLLCIRRGEYQEEDFPGGVSGKKNNPSVNAEDIRDVGSIPVSGRSPGGGWQPTPVILPGESHGQGSLAGYSPRSRKESDTKSQTRLKQVNTHAHIEKLGGHSACRGARPGAERRNSTVTARTRTKKVGALGRQRVRTSGAWVGADARAHSRHPGPQGKKRSVPT